MSPPSRKSNDGPIGFPQFRLRTLFLVTTVCGAFFAILGAIGFLASVGLIVVLSIVCLHVLGNVLGRKLREHSPVGMYDEASQPISFSHRPIEPVAALASSRLFERTSVGWTMRVFCATGALAGGTLGAVALCLWDAIRLPGIVLGGISSAVVGAFFGFLIGSFLEMALRAWWQAASEPKLANPPEGTQIGISAPCACQSNLQ